MEDWSLGRVLVTAAAYLVTVPLITVGVAYWRLPIERGPEGQWKFFWLFPYHCVRNYLLVLLVPPVLLLAAWLVARRAA